MSIYKFSPAERAAIYSIHGEKCYICSTPISLKTMEVDHVIPESLLEKRDELNAALEALGLPEDFSVNSFANWLPACRPCNGKKSNTVFKPSLLIQLHLQDASSKAEKTKERTAETLSDKRIATALNVLERAHQDGKLDDETIESLVDFLSRNRLPDLADEPIRLTPLYEILSNENGIQIIRGPYGVGGRPAAQGAHSSFDCPNCGRAAAWNGARCVICGEMNDD